MLTFVDNCKMKKASNSTKPLFLNYIHYLRGLAILLIVGIHCRISFSWGPNSTQERLFESILDNSTIIFVFISGFLFQHLFVNNFGFKKYIQKKFKYVIIPYIILSVLPILDKLYLESNLLWMPSNLENTSDFIKVLYMLATGKHFGPYWFIPMIILYYFISPLLVKMDNDRFYKYFFPIIFVFGLFTYQFGYYSNIFNSFLFFLPIYIFGMWASRYKEKIIHSGNGLFLLALLTYIGITILEVSGILEIHKVVGFKIEDPQPYLIFNFSKLKVCFLCLALIKIFFNLKHKPMTFLKTLGEYSFGIYFIHLYIIIVVQKTSQFLSVSFTLNIFSFLIYTFVITLICTWIVWVIKQIFSKHSRYIIGS